MPCSALSFSAACQRARHHQRQRADGGVLAGPHDLGGAERVDDLAVRHLALGGVERLVLEEDHRIGIAHRGRQQADDVARRRRRHHLEARDHHAPVLDALGVLRAEARARAVAGAHHQRAFGLPVRHVAALGKFVGDVVEADREEIREHDLGDRLQARHRRAHGGAEDRLLGDRRVAHAQRAELLVEADGRLEHAAGFGHVLAEEHDVGIALHLLRDAADDRVAIVFGSVPPCPASIGIDIGGEDIERRVRRGLAGLGRVIDFLAHAGVDVRDRRHR